MNARTLGGGGRGGAGAGYHSGMAGGGGGGGGGGGSSYVAPSVISHHEWRGWKDQPATASSSSAGASAKHT